MAEKRLAWSSAASVGWTPLMQAVMSHSKGGSENLCVNYDTGTVQALTSLDVTLYRSTKAPVSFVISCCKVCMLTSLLGEVVNAPLWCWNSAKWVIGLCFVEVCVCILVAPPPQWAYVVLWVIPPLQRLDGIQHTQTHWTEYIMQAEPQCRTETYRTG